MVRGVRIALSSVKKRVSVGAWMSACSSAFPPFGLILAAVAGDQPEYAEHQERQHECERLTYVLPGSAWRQPDRSAGVGDADGGVGSGSDNRPPPARS
jgi:hypothetical protein